MGDRIKFLTTDFTSNTRLANFSASSEQSAFPSSNIQDPFRSKVWRSSGHYDVDWSNYQFTINTGADIVVTLTRAIYTTETALATEIQTQLNSVSSGFTVSYSTATNKFSITRSSAFSALWTVSQNTASLLGFNPAVDDTGLLTYEADSRRIAYPAEWLKFDFGITRNPKAIILIDNLEEKIKIQPSITMKLQGAISDSWNSPEEISLSYNSENITKINIDGLFSQPYRYNRLLIEDVNNPLGYQQIGKIYLGDVFELESSDVQRALEEDTVDLSRTQRAIGGEVYSDERPSYDVFSNIFIEYCNKNDVDTIKSIYDVHRTHTPFFVSIDSEAKATNDVSEWTKYVRFSRPPKYQTVTKDIWNIRIQVEELL